MSNEKLDLSRKEELLSKLLEAYKSKIPENSYREISELIQKHGEYGLAFDNLCSDLEECQVVLSQIEFEYFRRLARMMEYEEDFISYYRNIFVK